MQTTVLSNVCVRCGKPRVVVKTWKERSQSGMVTHIQTSCPDKACQKIVDDQFAVQKQKREFIEQQRQKRILAPKLARK